MTREPTVEELQAIKGAQVWNGERWKGVKNLRWLLHNWKEVERFEVLTPNPPQNMRDAILVARMRGGKVYATEYASCTVLAEWLDRSVFETLPVIWYGTALKIGKGFAFDVRPYHPRAA